MNLELKKNINFDLSISKTFLVVEYSIEIITIVKLYFKEHADILCLSIKHDLS